MNILFVCTKSPLPLVDGASLRTYNLLREIARQHNVTLLSFVKRPEEHKFRDALSKTCSDVMLIDVLENKSKLYLMLSLIGNIARTKPFVADKYNVSSMRRMISDAISGKSIDLVHLDSLPLASYLDVAGNCAVVLNEHNVEWALLERRVSVERNLGLKLFYAIQQRKLYEFEKFALANIDSCIACSEHDKSQLKQMVPHCSVTVVPNGVDIDYFHAGVNGRQSSDRLVFVGGMNWFPNRDAIEWFDSEIMPLLLPNIPSLKVDVVGASEKTIRLDHSEKFIFHGFVDDIRPLVREAVLFVAPLRVGSGTRLKLLDAMAMGKGIVSTNIGAEGLEVTNGEQMLLADTPTEFAEMIVSLINDPEKRSALGNAARAFVEQKYSWDRIGKIMLGVYDDAVATHRAKINRHN